MKTHPVQQITDFEVGDVIRRSDYSYLHRSLGDKGTKHVVTGVFPGDNGSHEIPDRVGTLSIEGFGDEHFGHLLFDVPLTEDNLTIEELRDLLAVERAAADVLQRQRDETRATLDETAVALEQARADLEQQQAATALEALRANKAERRASRLQAAVDYANCLLPEDQKGRLQGFLDGLRRES